MIGPWQREVTRGGSVCWFRLVDYEIDGKTYEVKIANVTRSACRHWAKQEDAMRARR